MKKISIHTGLLAFQPRIAYVVSYLQDHPLKPREVEFRLNCPDANISIGYFGEGPGAPAQYSIPAQRLFFSAKQPGAELFANAYRFKGSFFYSVEQDRRPEQPFLVGRIFQFDILEAIFFHLSRYEEYYAASEDLDEWDMLKSAQHFLVRHQLHHWPVVDYLVAAFFRALGFTIIEPPTRVAFTHDLDALLKFPSLYKSGRAAVRLLAQGAFRKIPHLFQLFWKVKTGAMPDPFDTFDWLLAEKEGPQLLFLMAGGLTRYDNHYSIRSIKARDLIQLARQRGYQIGLHPSYACWKDPVQFQKEKLELEKVTGQRITVSRQHFLHFSFKDSIGILEEAEIEEDHTLGYQDRIGFRCGAGFPFKLYNFEQERESIVTEVPLIIMDSAILAEAKRKGEESVTFIRRFLEKNRKGTQVSVNFHNSSFDDIEWDRQQMKRLYAFIQEFFPGEGG